MFAGIIIRDSRAYPREFADVDTLMAALTPYGQADRTGAWQGNGALLVQALTWNSAESKHEAVPEICADTGRVIVGWVRLDNRAALCAQLGLELRETLTDPQLILAAHRAWGETCADRLEGDFSFVIYDPAHHAAFCARDALGARPFFYHVSDELFIFASSAAIFPALRNFDAAPSREWLARFLIGESADPVKSAYAKVSKLSPSHRLSLGRQGAVEPVRYWTFADTAPDSDRREDHWVDAYREAFHRAVEVRLRSAYRIGAENSGGLDSATIIGHAVGKLPGGGTELPCFSVCHMEREASYILDLASHCGVKHNYVLTRPSYQPEPHEDARALRVLGYPPEHGHALFHVPIFEQCQAAGVRTVLSGFGGDEIVTSPADFLTRELLLGGRYAQLFTELPGNAPIRAARMVTALATHRRAARGAPPSGRTPRLDRTLLRRDVIEEYGLTGLAQANGDAYWQARTLNDHLLARPAFRTLMVGRLEGYALIAGSYRIEYRWPMLDRGLIAQFLATPSIEKRHRQWGRYLHRRACSGTVPEQILWKETKALGGIPHVGRDRRLAAVNVDALPAMLGDIVDRGAVLAQAETVRREFHDVDQWFAKIPERNNLRALGALGMWLSGDWRKEG